MISRTSLTIWIRQTFLSKYLLMLDFIYIFLRDRMISRIIKINLSQFVQFCCWFKYAAIISVITGRNLSRSTVHMFIPQNVCKNIQEIHYDVQRTSCWRTVRMVDVEVLGHSGQNERAQNEITKCKLSVPGRRAYPTSRFFSSLRRLLLRAGPVRIDE